MRCLAAAAAAKAIALLASNAIAALGDGPGGAWEVVAGTGKSGFGGDTYTSHVHDFAVETRLNSPWGLALDFAFDRLYVADTVNGVVRCVDLQTGLMEVIAGSERQGDSGDGGPAVEAALNMPMGLAVDGPGRMLYIADTYNHRVRALALDVGRVYQAEGGGVLPAGDASLPANVDLNNVTARLTCPPLAPGVSPLLLGSRFCAGATGAGVAPFVDLIAQSIDFHVLAPVPGVYELRFRYADRYDYAHAAGERRLRVLVDGVAVTHELRFPPTGKLQAGLRDQFQWAVVSATLSVMPPLRNIVTLELVGYGGPVVDLLYVMPPRAELVTVAGTGTPGPPGCRNGCLAAFPLERDALASPLNHPVGLAVDDVDKLLYIADSENGRVLRLYVRTGKISTVVGGASRSSTRDGMEGSAMFGKLFRPAGLLLDSARRWLYIVDSGEMRVRRVDLAVADQDRTIVTVAGFGREQAPFEYLLRSPQDVALDDATGTLYISDSGHARVRFAAVDSHPCPLKVVSRLQCAFEDVDEAECVTRHGCCWDPNCLDGFNPDGRGPLAAPLDVLTKAEQKASVPPISFIRRGSGFCCYPNLRTLSTLDLLDSPGGVAFDPRDRTLYVAQTRAHRVVRLAVSASQCAADAMYC